MDLPEGVRLIPLAMHRDQRGWVSEIFRDEWAAGVTPCQWNVTYSEGNVLRGVHVHVRHRDLLVVVHGRISVGLYDARPRSPTHRLPAAFDLRGDELTAICIPTGVMHGFYCYEPTVYTYGVDCYFDPADELGCLWSDPALRIAWPCQAPTVSERDRQAGTLADVEARLRAFDAELAPT